MAWFGDGEVVGDNRHFRACMSVIYDPVTDGSGYLDMYIVSMRMAFVLRVLFYKSRNKMLPYALLPLRMSLQKDNLETENDIPETGNKILHPSPSDTIPVR